MSKELSLIILLCRCQFDSLLLRRIEHLLKGDIDWYRFMNIAVQSQTVYLTYAALRKLNFLYLLPQTIQNFLATAYFGNHNRNQNLMQAYEQLKIICQHENVPLYPIKGINLLRFVYPDIGLRYLSDLDFLLPSRYFEQMTQIMQRMKASLLYINNLDLLIAEMNHIRSMFFVSILDSSQESIKAYDFSSFCTESDHDQLLFNDMIDCISQSEQTAVFHVAQILLLIISCHEKLCEINLSNDMEHWPLSRLVDIQEYAAHYMREDEMRILKNKIDFFELHDSFACVCNCICQITEQRERLWTL